MSILKIQLKNKFKLKDLEKLNCFLGIKMSYFNEGIVLSQRKYTLGIFEKSGLGLESRLLGAKESKILIERNFDLKNDNSKSIEDPTFYKKLIEKLIYLNITRPDLSFALH